MGLPSPLELVEVKRCRDLGEAIALCLRAAGLEPKQVLADLKMDKAQFSRWTNGQEGVLWPKLDALMARCGNCAPVLWMVHQCNFQLESMRSTEDEKDRQLRVLREERDVLRRWVLDAGGKP